jgi:predicted dehydrogenase
MTHINRRSFMKRSFLATGGIGFSAHSWNQVLGANDAVRLAVVGFNGQGQSHIQGFQKIPGVRLVALCDVDRDVLGKQVSILRDAGVSVTPFTDVRKLLESKEVDAITTATPNHWHALVTIWACQAGKDVYVEKPVSHEVWEGRRMVEAARKYNRIVQTGTQTRSSTPFREALAWVAAGNLGKIRIARGLCYKRRKSIGKVSGPQAVPASVDYDLWCGPAPKGPLMRERLHYDWHWVWPTGNGDLGNQGIHQMDVARWALGENTLSPRVLSVGGRLGYVDDGETPNTQFIVHDYGDSLLIFEVRGLPAKSGDETMDKYRGQSVGNVVECENGYLSGTVAYDLEGNVIKKFSGPDDDEAHHGNFIKAVRSRKVSDLNADILEGHLSSALCHTGNISYRIGRQSRPEEIKEAIKGDKQALETYERMAQHLAANGVDLEKTMAALGPVLKMDVRAETFIDNPKANSLLRREYRQPFAVPEKV